MTLGTSTTNHLAHGLKSCLPQLLKRGDRVSIESGQLIITAVSGSVVPNEWLKQKERELITDIAKLTGKPALAYYNYKRGQYGGHRAEGVTLQFTNLADHSEAYAIYNVSIRRQRKGQAGQAVGELMPGKQFTLAKGRDLYKLWVKTGLPLHSSTKFCRYMGNLKGIVFTGEYDHRKPEKLFSKSILPLMVSHCELMELVGLIPKVSLSHAYNIPKPCLVGMPNQLEKAQCLQGSQDNSAAGGNNCGIRSQGKEVKGIPYPIPCDNKDTIGDWLSDYETASGDCPY